MKRFTTKFIMITIINNGEKRIRTFWSGICARRGSRAACAAVAAACAFAGALYLYSHDPYEHPLPCFYLMLTGFYCPGCGAGRACYSILHGRFQDAFCYNPLMVILLPLLLLYIVARTLDWVITGGDHVDYKISIRFLVALLILVFVYWIVRNIPVYPFTLLAPGGLFDVLK